MITNKIIQLKEVLIYLESWLDQTALIERFNVPRERILSVYDSFVMAKLTETEESNLKAAGVILSSIPNKKKLFIGETLTNRATFSHVDPDLDQIKPSVWIVQFIGPIKFEWTTELQNKGAQIYGYIQPYSVFAFMNVELVRELKQQDFVEWIGRYCQKTKIHSECGKNSIVHYFPWENKDCTHECICEYTVNYKELARSEGIFCIHPYIEPQLYNNTATAVLKTDTVHIQGITGITETIAITDTGIYGAHEMFANGKIAQIIDIAGDSAGSGGDGDGHGTHVAGSVAGNAGKIYDGQSPDSKLIMVKIFKNSGTWAAGDREYDFWKKAYLAGAKVNNNSWGSNSYGAYLSTDQDADKICVEYSDYVLVVANGNDGPGIESVGSPGVAKNVISVGACVSNIPNNMASFSSRGPTSDKRIKPDVVAPGTTINSAKNQTINSYVELQGTSMAAPQISGIAALIRQYFKEGKYSSISGSHNPSSALVKAILINGAVEMTGIDSDRQREKKFPNNSQGWGRVDASRSMPFEKSNRKITVWDILTGPLTGGKWTSFFDAPTGSKEIKINIVWTDPPSTPGSGINLVNNFNLKVITPDNKIFLGNNFKGLNPSYSITGGVLDSRNNVEGITFRPNLSFIGEIPAGKYTIEIISSYTSAINSGFAVVVGIDAAVNTSVNTIALVGDYNKYLETLLKEAGYLVDSYTDYPDVTKYKAVILNKVANTIGFDTVLSSGKPILFLGSYQIINHGIGVLSSRKKNPITVDNKWGNGIVKVKVNQIHPIFEGYEIGTVISLINGGDNDYQTYDGFTGTNIGANAMNSGLPYMIGIDNKNILLGSMGVSAYTNTTHWTAAGRKIFLNSVKSMM